ncbi:MAG: hypothetical protein DRJ66_06300 [Thermoprotei archaeon]|nr:MAG: hypothetical protein DRJ66_06300 [Thermoprotei archaeon]
MQSLRGEAIRLEDVWVAYAGSGRPAIRNINLRVNLGNLVLITGPNGAGKTTLIETCLGLLKPIRGNAYLLGVNTRRREIIKVRRLCSYVPQDFMKPPYETYTARRVIELGLASKESIFGIIPNDIRDYILRIARTLRIGDILDKPIGRLSGGQQQKVYIARALVRRPKVIFLDEPFSSLDRDSRHIVAKTIHEYVHENEACAVVVSHDVEPIKDLADLVVYMDNGTIVSMEEIGDV